jgi:hypothetical protein
MPAEAATAEAVPIESGPAGTAPTGGLPTGFAAGQRALSADAGREVPV